MNELLFPGPSITGLIGLGRTLTTRHMSLLMRAFRHPLAWLTLILSLFLLPTVAHADSGQDLMTAAHTGDLQMVRSLLGKGADINQQSINGATVLVIASQEGHTAVVQDLLDKGAKTDFPRNDGSTVLHMSSQYGQTAVVQALLDKGAEIDRQTKDGQTALFMASRDGHTAVVQALLDGGARSTHKITMAIRPYLGRPGRVTQQSSKLCLIRAPKLTCNPIRARRPCS